MEFNRKNRRRRYFSKYLFIIFFLFGKINMVSTLKKKIIVLTIILILLDQITKLLVTLNINLNTGISLIPSFFSLVYVQNTGAAWGMFSSGTIILALLSVIFLAFFVKYIIDRKDMDNFEVVISSMLIGGIVGNLIDRLVRGYVVDFFSFKIFSYNFPIFNVADCFIVISIILLLFKIYFLDKKKKVVNLDDSEGK